MLSMRIWIYLLNTSKTVVDKEHKFEQEVVYNEIKLICSACNKIQQYCTNLENMISMQTGQSSSSSTQSEKSVCIDDHYPVNKDNVIVTKWPCKQCPHSFRCQKFLRDHVRAKHLGECFKCLDDKCNKTFASENSMKTDFKKHSMKPSKMCHICCKMFLHQSELTQHLFTHSDTKNFKCDSCEKLFTFQYELNCPAKVCDTTVNCSLCGNSFKGKHYLKAHMETVHSNDWKYSCDQCPEKPKFKYCSTLHNHKQSVPSRLVPL